MEGSSRKNTPLQRIGFWVNFGDWTEFDILPSCADIYKSGVRQDGVYTIDPDGLGPCLGSFQVWCDMQTDGGGWTVFQKRQDGSVDFWRRWSEYRTGFGDLHGEFWLGLDKIYRLTTSGQNVLRVDLTDFNDYQSYAKYGTFFLNGKSDKFRLNVGSYSGSAGDSLISAHNNKRFTTWNNDNDEYGANCAVYSKGAWWYSGCHSSNLNGQYLGAGNNDQTGTRWNSWQGYSLKNVEMKIRPDQF